jgi:glycosyltransferase involved in cell wall biosynthesis
MRKLSIISINYNNKAGLQRTIDSVLCQTWKDFEWIIIDGGSTDGSKELIEKNQQHFTYWCSEPDNGVYHAMNKGVSHASGEYVNFMNSGDAFYDKGVLQKIVDLNSQADIISGKAVHTDSLKPLFRYNGSLLMQLYVTTISHQGAFIKKSLLNKYPYDENFKIVSDWKFWLQTIIWGDAKVQDTDILVAKYDLTGISSEMSPIHIYEREKVRNEFFPPLLRKEIEEYIQLRKSIYTEYGEFLRKNNHLLFAIGWRLLKLLVIIHNCFSKVLCLKSR